MDDEQLLRMAAQYGLMQGRDGRFSLDELKGFAAEVAEVCAKIAADEESGMPDGFILTREQAAAAVANAIRAKFPMPKGEL
jgi:hypothetical protein